MRTVFIWIFFLKVRVTSLMPSRELAPGIAERLALKHRDGSFDYWAGTRATTVLPMCGWVRLRSIVLLCRPWPCSFFYRVVEFFTVRLAQPSPKYCVNWL